ncbi:MAG: 3-dehydroquinate dehydratase [halophilic archaeon J07HX64]|nr:MAG: 3-dehydroquinate dehydratase [halophilic archaeon J07HX64]
MEFTEFVLAASTATLGEEPAARTHADILEYRLDLASDGVDALAAYDGVLPLLVTNRTEREGGEAADGPARLGVLETAIKQPSVAAVDVELAAIRDGGAERVVDHARERDVAVVVSTHDFERTPDRERMRALLRAGADHGDVAKLAVTAQNRGDVLDLLAVTDELSPTAPVATMAMGEPGRHSRVVAPLYGSCLGYAPVDPADATAPGQYGLERFRHLVDRLRGR